MTNRRCLELARPPAAELEAPPLGPHRPIHRNNICHKETAMFSTVYTAEKLSEFDRRQLVRDVERRRVITARPLPGRKRTRMK